LRSSPLPVLLRYSLIVTLGCIPIVTLTGCGTPGITAAPHAASVDEIAPTTVVPILLFNGTGTSSSDVAAVEAILGTLKLTYATADTSQIESMSESKLASYKLLIVPGGNSVTIGDHLSKTATTNIHNAVVNDGLHYLGICAGAFFGGYSIYNGLDLTSGVWFNLYANGGKGTGKTAVEIAYPVIAKLDQYWQDGPELDGWGSIVAKYPDGTSAVVEGKSGKGWVILSGFHPEAPASWRVGMTFTTSVAVDNTYAGTLVTAALTGTSLPHY
jgi:Biotin-protein ligase, N terminal